VLVRQGENIEFKCGATLERSDDGSVHTMVVHIDKWFGESRKWSLSVNEDLEHDAQSEVGHYRVAGKRINDNLTEFDFTILSKNFQRTILYIQKCCQECRKSTQRVQTSARPPSGILSKDCYFTPKVLLADAKFGEDRLSSIAEQSLACMRT